jgi:hypothetical protein
VNDNAVHIQVRPAEGCVTPIDAKASKHQQKHEQTLRQALLAWTQQIYAVSSACRSNILSLPRCNLVRDGDVSQLTKSYVAESDVGLGIVGLTVWQGLVAREVDDALLARQVSQTAKIDPLTAAFNAIALMSTNPWSSRQSIFVI